MSDDVIGYFFLKYFFISLYNDDNDPDDVGGAEEKAASHFNQMSTAFRNKAQQFAQQVISDVRPSVGANIQPLPPADTNHQQQQQSIPAIIAEPPAPSIDSAAGGGGGGAEPQAYHEESRLSEYGIRPIYSSLICNYLIE